MDNNEIIVGNQPAENGVQPTEPAAEPAQKLFTQEDMNSAVSKAKARAREKAERDTRKQYEALEAVLRAGTGKTNATTEELISDFTDFYKKQGVQFPTEPVYSDKDVKILARHEAEEIIRSGFEEVVEEVDRLSALGLDKMTAKEKEMFRIMATHRQKHERNHEFGKMGISEEVYNSEDFQKFVGMFDSKTPVKQICEVYQMTKPKKNIQPMGSMVTEKPADNGVKDFYTYEEACKFTKKDFDKNPALYRKVQESMRQW